MNTADVGVLTVIAPELNAARAALGFASEHKEKDDDGTTYWVGPVASAILGRPLRVALTCIAGAGNPSAAVATTRLLARYRPRGVILMGIAAGIRNKVRIGDVVLSERVVAYEPAAVVRDARGRAVTQRRPGIERLPHAIQQDVTNYQSEPPPIERITKRFESIGGTIPKPQGGQEEEYRTHVIRRVAAPLGSTIASGEKLLRNPAVLLGVREGIHGKIEVGEMEAVGFVEACLPSHTQWLVIRGISDFGDELKSDAFHRLASLGAASVLADFLQHGLELDFSRLAPSAEKAPAPTPSPFVVGRPIDRDEDFYGRDNECRSLQDYIGMGEPVEILGLPLSGRTSLLNWLKRHLVLDRAVVAVDAASGLTPRSLVREIARALGNDELVERAHRGDVDLLDILKQLGRFALLFDDADTLATKGEEFTEGFFVGVRSLVQTGQVIWVSVARTDLYSLFLARGLSSSFLNSSNKVYTGALDDAAATRLAARGGSTVASFDIIREAGRSPYLIQWLASHLHRHSVSFQEACDAFDDEMARIFATWWQGREPFERELLRQCAHEARQVATVESKSRRIYRRLRKLGLIREFEDGRLALEGAGWARFVRDAG